MVFLLKYIFISKVKSLHLKDQLRMSGYCQSSETGKFQRFFKTRIQSKDRSLILP